MINGNFGGRFSIRRIRDSATVTVNISPTGAYTQIYAVDENTHDPSWDITKSGSATWVKSTKYTENQEVVHHEDHAGLQAVYKCLHDITTTDVDVDPPVWDETTTYLAASGWGSATSPTSVAANALTDGTEYKILTKGDTNWAAYAQGTGGFTGTATTASQVAPKDVVAGKRYIITTLGTLDWSKYAVDTLGFTGALTTPTEISAQGVTAGVRYKITTVGDTDWTAYTDDPSGFSGDDGEALVGDLFTCITPVPDAHVAKANSGGTEGKVQVASFVAKKVAQVGDRFIAKASVPTDVHATPRCELADFVSVPTGAVGDVFIANGNTAGSSTGTAHLASFVSVTTASKYVNYGGGLYEAKIDNTAKPPTAWADSTEWTFLGALNLEPSPHIDNPVWDFLHYEGDPLLCILQFLSVV